jgi:hypothetical protein
MKEFDLIVIGSGAGMNVASNAVAQKSPKNSSETWPPRAPRGDEIDHPGDRQQTL